MAGVVTLQVARQLESGGRGEYNCVAKQLEHRPRSWVVIAASYSCYCSFFGFWLCSEPKDVPLVPTMLQHKQAIQQQIDWLL